jgi:hypothetical protein
MRRPQRLIATAVIIALSGALAGCGSTAGFDPSDLLDFLDTKKKLPGDRKPVFPEGVPGGSIWAFTRDDQGGLWLCENFKNLSLWTNGRLHPLDSFPGSSHLDICSVAFTDTHGRVWIGFADGRVCSYPIEHGNVMPFAYFGDHSEHGFR